MKHLVTNNRLDHSPWPKQTTIYSTGVSELNMYSLVNINQ